MSSPRLCSDGAPQTAHDIWENWTAGASNAGDSFSLSLGRRGAMGFPLLTTWDSVAGLGRAPIPENISGRKPDPGTELSRFGLGSPRDRGLGRDVTSATLDSGRGITGGGSGYAAIWRTREEFCTVWNSAQ